MVEEPKFGEAHPCEMDWWVRACGGAVLPFEPPRLQMEPATYGCLLLGVLRGRNCGGSLALADPIVALSGRESKQPLVSRENVASRRDRHQRMRAESARSNSTSFAFHAQRVRRARTDGTATAGAVRMNGL